jgi:two-component system nitrate/nitrite response regulator NarL
MLNEDSEPSHSQPIEILLVDDHPLVRRILRKMIESYGDLKVVGEAVNGEEAVLLAARLKPAVVIMDIHLPILSGISASTLIKANNPFVSVIALTAGGPCQDEKAMTIAGAAAVINKDDVLHALRPAILNAVKRVKHPV